MAAERLPIQLVCRVLDISESGYYDRRNRAPSQRAIRHVWLTDLIVRSTWTHAAPTVRAGSTPSCASATASRSGTVRWRC